MSHSGFISIPGMRADIELLFTTTGQYPTGINAVVLRSVLFRRAGDGHGEPAVIRFDFFSDIQMIGRKILENRELAQIYRSRGSVADHAFHPDFLCIGFYEVDLILKNIIVEIRERVDRAGKATVPVCSPDGCFLAFVCGPRTQTDIPNFEKDGFGSPCRSDHNPQRIIMVCPDRIFDLIFVIR